MHQSNSVAKLSHLACSRFVHVLFVHVLFTFCSSVATLQQVLHICHTWFCSRFVRLLQNCHCCKNVTVAKLPQTPRVCELISCCLSPFWGEILNICHFVTIGHHWSPLVTIGHLRLSYTPLTKLQKTCIIVLNTTNASEAGMSWKVRIYLSKHKEDWLYLIDVKTFKPKVFDNWTDAQEAANLWSNSDIELNRSSKEVSNAT